MIKNAIKLSSIISLRFLGLFLVLPVLSAYAVSLENSTTFLVGVAVGGYAITQAVLQVPFVYLSEKIGKKTTIALGLVIFLIGSLICAYSTDIYSMLLGRLLQGAGAIGSVAVAFITDLVKEEGRGYAMAIMGGFIALSFAIALIIGPILSSYYDISFLFILTAIFAVIAIILLYTTIPNVPKISKRKDNTKLIDVLKSKDIVPLYVTGFLQKAFMTAAFVVIPFNAIYNIGISKSDLYTIYVPATIIGIFAMGVASMLAEKHNRVKTVFISAILFFVSSFILLGLFDNKYIFITGVTLFFVGFNMMEPILQSTISKVATISQKEKALGIANALSYFGTFIGGSFGGWILHYSDITTLSICMVAISIIWLIYIAVMKAPKKYSNIYNSVDETDVSKLGSLNEYIRDWYINEDERTVVIKFRKDIISKDELLKLITISSK